MRVRIPPLTSLTGDSLLRRIGLTIASPCAGIKKARLKTTEIVLTDKGQPELAQPGLHPDRRDRVPQWFPEGFLKAGKAAPHIPLIAARQIDNSLIENVLRPAKLGLRNYLFIGDAEAGASTA